MTNFERIKEMDPEQFYRFLRLCDFNRPFAIIEGERFFTREEVIDWLNKESEVSKNV